MAGLSILLLVYTISLKFRKVVFKRNFPHFKLTMNKEIQITGKKIFYRVTGEGNPVMLVHGFGERWNRVE